MLAQEYLTLRLVRLKPPEKWVPSAQGLTFVFLKEGSGRYVSSEVTHCLSRGDVLVLNGPGENERGLFADERGGMVFSFFAAHIEHLYPLFAVDEVCLLPGIAQDFKGARLYPASSPVAAECHQRLADIPPDFGLDHRSRLLGVVAAILTSAFNAVQSNRTDFTRTEKHLVQVFEALSANDLLSLSVGELASRFSCSKRHLNRLFHQHFGISVAALRMEMRLLKAASLLRDPETKIINVAEECGFNHLGLFNTCFKRRFGASPGQWRKTSARAEGESVHTKSERLRCPLQFTGICPWRSTLETRRPAEGEAAAPAKGPLAKIVAGKQIPDASVGFALATGHQKPAGTPSRQNLIQPGL